MKQKLIAYWNSLPPWAKGAILIGGAAASGAVKKYYDAPNPCWSLHCIGLLALAALHVGGVAAGAWLIKSPIGQKLLAELPAQNPPALKISCWSPSSHSRHTLHAQLPKPEAHARRGAHHQHETSLLHHHQTIPQHHRSDEEASLRGIQNRRLPQGEGHGDRSPDLARTRGRG